LSWRLRSFSDPTEHIGIWNPIVPSCNTDQGVYRGCKRLWKEVGKQNEQSSFFHSQSRNESDPPQKARNSAVFILIIKTTPG
jgi:hypothetical protein